MGSTQLNAPLPFHNRFIINILPKKKKEKKRRDGLFTHTRCSFLDRLCLHAVNQQHKRLLHFSRGCLKRRRLCIHIQYTHTHTQEERERESRNGQKEEKEREERLAFNDTKKTNRMQSMRACLQ